MIRRQGPSEEEKGTKDFGFFFLHCFVLVIQVMSYYDNNLFCLQLVFSKSRANDNTTKQLILLKGMFFLSSVQFSHSVLSNSLWFHGLSTPAFLVHHQSPTPWAYSDSCPSHRWCHPTISSSVVPFSSLLSFPALRSFSNESGLHIRWSKYWSFSFSISPSNEYSGLISFRIDWLNLFAVQETLMSLLQHHS